MSQRLLDAPMALIKAEHDVLNREVACWRQWWDELRELGLPHFGEMGGRVAQFRAHLVSHIAHEEELLEEHVRSVGAEALSRLQAQHGDLVAELDRLIERLRACQPDFPCWGDAGAEFERFLEHLQVHEVLEEELLRRVD